MEQEIATVATHYAFPPPPPTTTKTHVLIFPAPGQGHVNPMLKLAELLAIAGLKITFLNYKHIHDDLVRFSDIETHFSKYSGFQFNTIPFCLPVDSGHPPRHRDFAEGVRQLLEAMNSLSKPIFKKMLIDHESSCCNNNNNNNNSPFTCIIGDIMMGFVHDVATELGIPVIQFNPSSCCFLWTCTSVPGIISAGELPIKGKEDMDRLITKVTGMETFLRCRDLPAPFQVSDTSDPALQMFLAETRTPRALIINTFEELEAPILSQIRNHCPKIYTIGPLHLLLKTKLISNKMEESCSSNNLWEVDRTCMKWLDDQPSQSVLYVSFGSFTILTIDQLMEFWHGIINSKTRFLWVIRPFSVTKKNGDPENLPQELEEGPKENGYIVKWAPQEEVLGHRAVGGFLTHSGWNSTLESIVAGVPMICWPYYGDQHINSRFVSEVWKLGLDMKDVCDRRIVMKMVNDLMVDKREKYIKSVASMAETARKSVIEGGSSTCCLDRLIQDIRLMSIQQHTI